MSIFERYISKFKKPHYSPIEAPKLTNQEFKLFEANFGIRLPDDFKGFYSAFNGFVPNGQYYRLRTKFHFEPELSPDSLSIDGFMILLPEKPQFGGGALCILPGYYPGDPEGRDIESDSPLLNGWDPKKCEKYLTFGEANNHQANLLLGISEENFGQIFFWHEDDDEIGNPHFLNDTIFDFLDEMGKYKDVMV